MLFVTSQMQKYTKEFSESLQSGSINDSLKLSKKISPLRMAQILIEVPHEHMIEFLKGLSVEQAGIVISHFPPEFILTVFEYLDTEQAALFLNEVPPEQIATFIDDLPSDLRSRLNTDVAEQVSTLSSFPEGSSGSVMSPYFLAIEKETVVADAIEAVRSAPSEIERTAYVFVVDSIEAGKLLGVLSLRELMLSTPNVAVSKVMNTNVLAARADESALESAQRIRSRNLKMLPVVDSKDRLIGIIHITKAMDILAHELADDFVSINAGSPDETFFTPPHEAVQKRLPWMAANIFLNLGAVAVISSFEDTLVQVAILAAFLPMITDMGGNVGIQALSVSIRSMALGEARLRDFWKAVRKEAAIGVFNGLALGGLFAILAYFLQGSAILGIIAGLALATNVLVAGVVGGTMPFLIKRLGKDPAMMTGPVLTTITDITGVSIYLGLSTVFLASLLTG